MSLRTFGNIVKEDGVMVYYETEYHGIVQYKCTKERLRKPSTEPQLPALRSKEQQDIKIVASLLYYFTYDEWPAVLADVVDQKTYNRLTS